MTSILFLAIDGLRYDLLVNKDKQRHFPNLSKLFNSHTSVIYPGETNSTSMSAASWSTIFSGKTQNVSSSLLENDNFDLAKKGGLVLLNDIKKKQYRLKTCISSWSGMDMLVKEVSDQHTFFPGEENLEKIETNDKNVVKEILKWLPGRKFTIRKQEHRKKECLLAYLLIMDETGHHYGYESPEYLEALKKLDNWIGRITKKIDNRTKLIITTDHGGMDWTQLTPTQQGRFKRLYGMGKITKGVHGLPLPKMTQSFLLLRNGSSKKNNKQKLVKNGIETVQYHEKIINWINGMTNNNAISSSSRLGNGNKKTASKNSYRC